MNTLNRRINEKVKDKFPELNIEIRIMKGILQQYRENVKHGSN